MQSSVVGAPRSSALSPEPEQPPEPAATPLEKAPTGISGLDELTFGGLPRGRPTLVAGGTGSGKTLLAMEFLLHGISKLGEPGVFFAFEETPADLTKNLASLGFDLRKLEDEGKLVVEHIHVDRAQIAEAGAFDLEGLFIRLQFAIDSVGAKRVAIDTLETIFGAFTNEALLRGELRRLFRWLKDRHLTAIITAEKGDGDLTRQGMEEYVSDCVLLLDHRVEYGISTRHLRVVKYRGSMHGTNEYPFLIDETGISVLPVSSLTLDHTVSDERISSGIPRLDAMMDGNGYYRGSSILVSGTAGSGKSTVAASFVDAACARGERCLYLSFEESPSQLSRNMRSIGINLQQWVDRGLLQFSASRPTVYGLEMHLVTLHKLVRRFRPRVVVIDPLTSLVSIAKSDEVHSMLVRTIDFLKTENISALFTSLTSNAQLQEDATQALVPSIIDTWLLVRDMESDGERNRGMYIVKSRGMSHSNQIREFLLTPQGIELTDVYTGRSGVLTGSARLAMEAHEEQELVALRQEIESLKATISQKRKALESELAAIQANFQVEEQETMRSLAKKEQMQLGILEGRVKMARKRNADELIASRAREEGQ